MNKILGLLLCVAIVIISILYLANSTPQQTWNALQKKVSLAGAPSPLLVRKEEVAAAYRLSPDKRFLKAVAEIDHFLTGKPQQSAIATFKEGTWTITYNGEPVGELPDLPDFSDGMQLLTQWVKTVHARSPLHLVDQPSTVQNQIDSDIEKFLAPNLAAALRKINRAWQTGTKTQEFLQSGTKALVLLNLQTLDKMETADTLPAKAMALLALTKSLTDHSMVPDEALLANTMGYSAHAVTVVQSLPKEDPLRQYVYHRDNALLSQADSYQASPRTHYLALLRLATSRNIQTTGKWIEKYFSESKWTPPISKTALDLNRFAVNRSWGNYHPSFVLKALEQAVSRPASPAKIELALYNPRQDASPLLLTQTENAQEESKQESLADKFDTELRELRANYSGPFLNSDTYQAYFRAHFYSALYILGDHYLDTLASPKPAKRLAAALGNARHGTANSFRQWYQKLIQHETGTTNVVTILQDLTSLPHFGFRPIWDTYQARKSSVDDNIITAIRIVKLLAKQMDSRVDHRQRLAMLAQDELLDVPLMELLNSSVIATAPLDAAFLRAQVAYYAEDASILKSMLHEEGVNQQAKLAALEYLIELKAFSDNDIRREFGHLLQTDPNTWRIRETYMTYLEQQNAYAEARLVGQDWLDRDVKTGGLQYANAHTNIAHLYYLEKRYQEGLEAVQPGRESGSFWGMKQTALLLEQTGQAQQAEELATKAFTRYPSHIPALTHLMGLLWRQGQYDKAAEVKNDFVHPITRSDWRWKIGKEYLTLLETQGKEQAMLAFAALQKAGIPPRKLQGLAFAANYAGHAELAFTIQSQQPFQGLDHLLSLVNSYQYRKAWKGKVSALAWLRARVPRDQLNLISMSAYSEQQYELLWELIVQPDINNHPEVVWLIRAAASLDMSDLTKSRHDALLNYYKQGSSSLYHVLGRYLLGLASQEEVLAYAVDKKTECEIAYYLGWKAQTAGRYHEASGWYRLAMETEVYRNGEYHWAHDHLLSWKSHHKNLALLAETRK